MARPIPLELPPRDARAALCDRLQNAPVEHAEAVLAAYEVLQGLHDRGVLELLRGALTSSDKILENIVGAAGTPEAIGAMRNLLILASALGTIEPELLKGLVHALSQGLAQARRQEPNPPGLWALLRKLRSKDSRRAMAALTGVLEMAGRNLSVESADSRQLNKSED
jgi:uncharacterized protein YjgD (DUF1641 family)